MKPFEDFGPTPIRTPYCADGGKLADEFLSLDTLAMRNLPMPWGQVVDTLDAISDDDNL